MLYAVKIALLFDKVPAEKADEYFAQHRAWFAKHSEVGNFLMLGPLPELDHTGLIIAQAQNYDALDAILKEDVYYPIGGASYETTEFKAVMIADNIKQYQA